jgi:hypothetical protein
MAEEQQQGELKYAQHFFEHDGMGVTVNDWTDLTDGGVTTLHSHTSGNPIRLQFNYAGTIYAVNNFSGATFPYTACTISKWRIYLGTAPGSGNSITVRVNKNGAQISTIQISDGNTTAEATGLSTALLATDVITVDVSAATGVGADMCFIIYAT